MCAIKGCGFVFGRNKGILKAHYRDRSEHSVVALLKARVHLWKWVEPNTKDADEICDYCVERGWLRPTYELVNEHVAKHRIFLTLDRQYMVKD